MFESEFESEQVFRDFRNLILTSFLYNIFYILCRKEKQKSILLFFREYLNQSEGEDIVYFYDFVRVFAHFKPLKKNPEKNLMNLREDKLRCENPKKTFFIPWVDFMAFFARAEWEPFLVNNFGKWRTNLAKFSNVVWQNSAVLMWQNIGKTEWQSFCAVLQQLFAWCPKFGEIDPWAQFHQCSTYSFYASRSQKHKKDKSSCQSFLRFRDLRT